MLSTYTVLRVSYKRNIIVIIYFSLPRSKTSSLRCFDSPLKEYIIYVRLGHTYSLNTLNQVQKFREYYLALNYYLLEKSTTNYSHVSLIEYRSILILNYFNLRRKKKHRFESHQNEKISSEGKICAFLSNQSRRLKSFSYHNYFNSYCHRILSSY